MDIFASRDAIARQAFDAARARLGADGNPWPEGTEAHAIWQAEYDRLTADLDQAAA